MKLLDIGCGSGSINSYMYYLRLGKKYKIFGADFDPQNIKTIRDLYPEGKFTVSKAERLPYRSNTFDAVLCRHVLEHVRNLDKTLEELVRVSKNGAIVYIAVPDPALESTAVMIEPKYLSSKTVHLRVFTKETIVSALERRSVSVRKISRQKWPLFVFTIVAMFLVKRARVLKKQPQTGGIVIGSFDYRKSGHWMYKPVGLIFAVLNSLFFFLNDILPFEIEVEGIVRKGSRRKNRI